MQYRLRMVQRHFWQKLVEQNWHERSIVWLAGVGRVSKTFLCQSLPDTVYFDCELPRARRMMEDAEAFLGGLRKRRIRTVGELPRRSRWPTFAGSSPSRASNRGGLNLAP